ncbi:trans-aconitate 2-methyltransferase [Pigmentiphaga soli]|uniref:Trans-aconitate 2-methyltransferase n=1 Tax=Pigmentiphaga soli TaxID=1007095 RepID=A0ABP8GJY6_9BURK
MAWSATQYLHFEDERTRPVRDLLAAVPNREVRLAADLGCGPGNSTEVVARRYPQARLIGVDNSEEMLVAARKRLPDVEFQLADISTWDAAGPFDLLFANASLQWVPDHERLLPSLAGRLAPGGTLAVQVPDNLDGPAHRLMRDLAADGPWAPRLSKAAAARTGLKEVGWYYDLLRPHCARVEVWLTIYHHPLAGGAAAVVDWFKGTGLRPFLDPLDADERQAYLERYTAGIEKLFPPHPDGCVLLPFPRMFIVATRG